MFIFSGNSEKIDYSSDSFKILWENENGIETDELKILMQKKSVHRENVIAAITGAKLLY